MKNMNQKGRSMVEMLGVLAIVGVLSVGAIAGYSKAMFKYKMNKTMDIISHAVARVAELDTMNFGGEIGSAQDMIDYGIMPDCDVDYIDNDGNVGEACPLPLGQLNFAFASRMFSKAIGWIDIRFTNNPFDSCVAFFNSGIYKNVPEDWWLAPDEDSQGGNIYIFNQTPDSAKYIYGKSTWAISQGAKPQITNTDILEACEICKNEAYCVISWVIRHEL